MGLITSINRLQTNKSNIFVFVFLSMQRIKPMQELERERASSARRSANLSLVQQVNAAMEGIYRLEHGRARREVRPNHDSFGRTTHVVVLLLSPTLSEEWAR